MATDSIARVQQPDNADALHLAGVLAMQTGNPRIQDRLEEAVRRTFHELLDLDYLIPALVVGGLASREKRMVRRFKFLRPDGVVLR